MPKLTTTTTTTRSLQPLLQVCSFVIVPGPCDPSPIDAFPRPPLPPSVLKQFTEKVSFTPVFHSV